MCICVYIRLCIYNLSFKWIITPLYFCLLIREVSEAFFSRLLIFF